MKSLREFKEEINGIFEKEKLKDPLKNLQFIRWGDLNPVKQKGYVPSEEDDFHSPPARKGIYAFPYPHIETFILGSRNFIPDRHEWVKRPDGKTRWVHKPEGGKSKGFISTEKKLTNLLNTGKIDQDQFDREMDKAEKEREEREELGYFLAKDKPPKKFTHEGDIWHHLITKAPEDKIKARKDRWIKTDIETYKNLLKKELVNMEKYKEREGYGVAKDHLEVFIERIQSSKKLEEMPVFQDDNLDFGDELEGYEKDDIIGKRKSAKKSLEEIFSFGEFEIYIWWQNKNKSYYIDVFHEDDYVAEFIFYQNETAGWMQSETASVVEEWRGKGIAFKVYTYMIENYFKALMSGGELTGELSKGSFHLWQKLGNLYPHKYIYDDDYETLKRVEEFTKNQMGNESSYFVVSLEDLEVEELDEKWERPLALGYSKETGKKGVKGRLGKGEKIPGETLFPTYNDLKKRKSKMSQYDLDFTLPYSEFKRRPSGEK